MFVFLRETAQRLESTNLFCISLCTFFLWYLISTYHICQICCYSPNASDSIKSLSCFPALFFALQISTEYLNSHGPACLPFQFWCWISLLFFWLIVTSNSPQQVTLLAEFLSLHWNKLTVIPKVHSMSTVTLGHTKRPAASLQQDTEDAQANSTKTCHMWTNHPLETPSHLMIINLYFPLFSTSWVWCWLCNKLLWGNRNCYRQGRSKMHHPSASSNPHYPISTTDF